MEVESASHPGEATGEPTGEASDAAECEEQARLDARAKHDARVLRDLRRYARDIEYYYGQLEKDEDEAQAHRERHAELDPFEGFPWGRTRDGSESGPTSATGEAFDSSGPAVRPINGDDPSSATVSDTTTPSPRHPDDSSPTSPPASSPKRTRAEQSRVNGAKGRGPRTAEGKARSSRNAVTHGLTATFEGLTPEELERFGLLMPEEDPEEYRAFLRAFVADLRPVGVAQGMLAERAASLAWKLRRLPLLETFALRVGSSRLGDFYEKFGALGELVEVLTSDDDPVLLRLHRYEGRIERSLRSCLRELRLMQGAKDGDGVKECRGDGVEEKRSEETVESDTVTQDVRSPSFSGRTAGPLEEKNPPKSPPISGSFCQPRGTDVRDTGFQPVRATPPRDKAPNSLRTGE